jgi:hypothetical protein
MRSSVLAFLTIALAACGPTDDGDDTGAEGVLEITPGSVTLTVIDGVAVRQPYVATLHRPDGTDVDVTAETSWTTDVAALGYFDDATLVASGAGRGTILAHHEDEDATAIVEIFARDVRVVGPAPGNSPDLFGAATDDPARLASIVYPAADTIVPPNLGDFDLHWRDATGSDLFELRLSTYYADARIYVAGAAAAGAWVAFLEDEWSLVAGSELGATIDVGVRGLTIASPATSSHATIRVSTSREEIQGGVYYWAATSASGAPEGIYRHDMTRPGEPAEQFYTTAQTPSGRCVACHVLSRDGATMALTYDGGDQEGNVLDVATRTTMMPMDAYNWNFATFTPDGTRLLTASHGVLTLRDPVAGTALATATASGWATHPDFSPAGDRIAFVRPGSPGADWTFTGGSIMTETFDDSTNTFGAETPLVVSAGANNYYPAFSPDGDWILFNRASDNADAYNALNAELWVVKADGSLPPVKLSLANLGPGFTNSWARWAPFAGSWGSDEEPILWLTFSSKRDFGVRLVGAARPQIWMTAFFPSRAAQGLDPTAPSFRLPCQDLETSNHIAQWTESVVPVN